MTEPRPVIVVMAGPNGAGKSTLAPALVRDGFQIREFVNADEIARGLSGFDPAGVALQAGRLMLQRLRELAANRESFAFETTLATRSYAPWLQRLTELGYGVELCFVSLPTFEMAISRVADRVRLGGHDIPAQTIERRFHAGLRNFFQLYRPLADRWTVFDNSRIDVLRVVATGSRGLLDTIPEGKIWDTFRQRYDRPEGS